VPGEDDKHSERPSTNKMTENFVFNNRSPGSINKNIFSFHLLHDFLTAVSVCNELKLVYKHTLQ
jgi:hypothetical protein